jgi:hypothetical protein
MEIYQTVSSMTRFYKTMYLWVSKFGCLATCSNCWLNQTTEWIKGTFSVMGELNIHWNELIINHVDECPTMEGQGDSHSHPLFIEMSHKSLAPHQRMKVFLILQSSEISEASEWAGCRSFPKTLICLEGILRYHICFG